MAIKDDIAVDGSGNITYTGQNHGVAAAGYYSVIELHRYLMDLADDAVASGDDLVDITSDTPSDRSTDNIITLLAGYRLAAGSKDHISEHLYDGSIIQNDDGSIWDGLVVIASEGMDLQIIQNGALVANDFWNSIPNGETLKGLNRDVANGISHRFMIQVNNAGTEIDGRRMVGITREFGKTYSEFKINGTARGNNVMALTYADDLNNAKTLGTIAGYTDITNGSEAYIGIDVNNDTTNEFYYSAWTKGSREINDLYERLKWATEAKSGTTASTSAATLYGLDGNIFRGITHQVDYGSLAGGTFTQAASVSFANGATAQILASDGGNPSGSFWVQVLTGTIPTSGGITQGGVTATVTGSTEKTVSAPFAGLSTGSALIGAYGLGLVIGSLSAADKLTALDGITYTPPNNVTFSVNGIVSGEDRVLVGPESGGALQTNQFQTSGAVSSGATSIILATNSETAGTGSNSTDTPNTGHIRILDQAGVYQSVSYTGRTMGSGQITFTGCSGMGANADAGANAYVAYIDVLASASTETFTSVYSANRPLYIRVRDGGTAGDNEGIKTFETTGTLGTAGGSTTAIRTSDV